ncbi:entericidin A/B family lipoprotein [Immundisolibacter sp.]|nr:entericidin A/B family lipoprotein [Immundisolibacter sp.]MDD3650812.1 entericidin A/B family lipoprotein [Immundisolibacter sp.]
MRGLKLLLVGGLVLALGACNTIAGIGKDIQRGGEAIEKSTK